MATTSSHELGTKQRNLVHSLRSLASSSSHSDFLHQLSSANGVENWGPLRRRLLGVLYSSVAEVMIGVVVVIGYVLMIVETNAAANGEAIPRWLPAASLTILTLYTSEVIAKICVLRGYFFWSAVNIVDLVVVVIDISAMSFYVLGHSNIPSLAALRVFRVLKLARGMGVIVRFPQLALLIKGLVRAMTAVFYGIVLLFMILSVWSVCAVQLIHPINQRIALTGAYDGCTRCPDAYMSVQAAMVTFFQQTIAGDSWGLVTIPIIEEAPETIAFFAAVYVSIHFTMINVILAVIVDAALKVSQEDAGEIVRQKTEANKAAANKLLDMCRDMDQDGSGDLTLEELLVGYEDNMEFQQHLRAMDIGQDDMKVVYSILDNDEDGSVSYSEFISELIKMKSHDSHTLLVFIKHQVTEIRKDMRAKMNEMMREIMQEVHGQLSGIQQSAMPAKPLSDASVELERGEHESPDVQGKLREPPPGAQTEPFIGAGDALRSLREGVGTDLLRFLEELSLKSEMHRQLLSRLPDDHLLAPLGNELGGSRSLSAFAANGLPADTKGPGWAHLRPCQTSSMRGLEPPPHGLGWPPKEASSLEPSSSLVSARRHGSHGHAQPASGCSPASAWSRRTCCSVEKSSEAQVL